MKVLKKVNNNVVLALNKNDDEVFVVGKGLGFNKTPYILDENSELVEKVFVQKDDLKYRQLFDDIPSDIIVLSEDIIFEGKALFGENLNESIIMALSDHINTAVLRNEEGEELKNKLNSEIRHIYPTEIEMGYRALEMIKERLNVDLPESEAAFIALHFVNGQMNNESDFTETSKITKIIRDIISIVKYNYKLNIDEHSINFTRFITHLRYFIYRLMNNEALPKANVDLLETVKSNAADEINCINKINKYLVDNHNWEISNDEKLYLILHLNRVTKNI